MKSRLVLFDIDGTLLLSAGAGRRAILAALEAELRGCETAGEVRFDGKTDPQILCELLAAAGHADAPTNVILDELCGRYLRHLEAELELTGHLTTVMPGILE
ncbi:MAG: HAD family hydrolase, partial [Gemmatimonadales bacterium]